jgi:glycosyltransferase involved in cell wall biosynthesis
MRDGTTLVIPTIKPRRELLIRAVDSALDQTRVFDRIIVQYDTNRMGAGPTRTKGMREVTTQWTAFLDDDDVLYPHHHQTLLDTADQTGADLVYPWFDVKGGTDPFPMFEGRVFDPAEPNMFPVTVLARTELLHHSHGFPLAGPEGDDWPLWLELVSMGAKIVHVPIRTWRWNHHQGNTSGRPDRW